MGFFASLFGGGAEQAPQPAKNTRLVDAMGRWSATVKIAGEETEVFKVEHQVGKTTCFIAAEEGKEFEVWFDRLVPPSTDESVWLYVDGKAIDGYVRRRGFGIGPTTSYIGKQVSAREVRPFVFAPIALTDDATKAVRDEAIIKGLGTIRLDVYRVTYKGTAEAKTNYTDESKEQLVDEKCKKATLSHSTTFGAPKYAPAPNTVFETSRVDEWGSPLCSLIFHYRSRALLEIKGIAEPLEAPKPVPGAKGRSSSTSASPKLEAGSRANSSSATAGKKKQKRKKIELTLPDSSDEDDNGGKLRAKIARLEAEVATLRGGVKDENKSKVKKETFKARQENGKVVLDLLDE